MCDASAPLLCLLFAGFTAAVHISYHAAVIALLVELSASPFWVFSLVWLIVVCIVNAIVFVVRNDMLSVGWPLALHRRSSCWITAAKCSILLALTAVGPLLPMLPDRKHQNVCDVYRWRRSGLEALEDLSPILRGVRAASRSAWLEPWWSILDHGDGFGGLIIEAVAFSPLVLAQVVMAALGGGHTTALQATAIVLGVVMLSSKVFLFASHFDWRMCILMMIVLLYDAFSLTFFILTFWTVESTTADTTPMLVQANATAVEQRGRAVSTYGWIYLYKFLIWLSLYALLGVVAAVRFVRAKLEQEPFSVFFVIQYFCRLMAILFLAVPTVIVLDLCKLSWMWITIKHFTSDRLRWHFTAKQKKRLAYAYAWMQRPEWETPQENRFRLRYLTTCAVDCWNRDQHMPLPPTGSSFKLHRPVAVAAIKEDIPDVAGLMHEERMRSNKLVQEQLELPPDQFDPTLLHVTRFPFVDLPIAPTVLLLLPYVLSQVIGIAVPLVVMLTEATSLPRLTLANGMVIIALLLGAAALVPSLLASLRFMRDTERIQLTLAEANVPAWIETFHVPPARVLLGAIIPPSVLPFEIAELHVAPWIDTRGAAPFGVSSLSLEECGSIRRCFAERWDQA